MATNNQTTDEIYSVRYKKNLAAIKEVHFKAPSEEAAKKLAQKWCTKHGLFFVNCKPFVHDLTDEFEG